MFRITKDPQSPPFWAQSPQLLPSITPRWLDGFGFGEPLGHWASEWSAQTVPTTPRGFQAPQNQTAPTTFADPKPCALGGGSLGTGCPPPGQQYIAE